MEASFVDFRKNSSQIIRALQRNETITVMYRGKPTAIMRPLGASNEEETMRAEDHPAFGIWADRDDIKDVDAQVRHLRQGRHDDL